MLPYLLVSGITTGMLYALVAVGLVLVFRSTGHINFAHGELFMVGGFLAYTAHVMLGWPYPLALVVAVAGGFVLGMVIDRIIFRPLIAAPGLSIILATVGLSFMLKGASRYFWGGQGDYVSFPPVVPSAPFSILGVMVIPQQILVSVGALVCMVVLTVFFRATTVGKAMKATAENQRAAYLVGIRVERVYLYTWACGGALAAIAGCLMAPLTLLSPDIGFPLLLKAFAATVLGGLGSMTGAIAGGLAVGIIESLAGGYIASSVQDVSAFVVIMVVLVLRPYGIFGEHAPREA